jgi:hypothetical protein
MLERYKNDTRVMMVAGRNALGEWKSGIQDYHFSLDEIWGWASWRRAWAFYDAEMRLWKHSQAKDCLRHFVVDPNIYEKMIPFFEKVSNNDIDTWDYQWLFSMCINSGLAIIPSKNLISNIGFGADATHTKGTIPAYYDLPVYEMTFPLRHNELMVMDRDYVRRAKYDVRQPSPKKGAISRLRRLARVFQRVTGIINPNLEWTVDKVG